MEERIADLEAQSFAYGLALRHLLAAVWPDSGERRYVRDLCCDSVERLYSEKLTEGAHERLQRILHEMEQLFQLSGGAAKAIEDLP